MSQGTFKLTSALISKTHTGIFSHFRASEILHIWLEYRSFTLKKNE